MKSYSNIFFRTVYCLMILCLLMVSCKKDFLEIIPKGKLIATTVSDYNLLLSHLDLINQSTDAQVLMGDEMAAVGTYFLGGTARTQRLFRWDDVIYEPDQDAIEMNVPMRNIYVFNKIILEAPNAIDGTDLQKKSIVAEARAGRAWSNFLLINYYGKPYNPATAATDPGYPIVTEADVTQTQFTRASVKEMYDFILADLTAAIPDLPAQTTHRTRMSRASAEAILGKVYLFMGRYADALKELNASIADLATATTPVRLYDYNVNFATGGIFLPIGTFGPAYPTTVNNEENLYAKQFSNTWNFVSSELVLTPATIALYGSSDLRRRFMSATPYPSGSAFPAGTLRKTGPNATQFGMVLPDVYLMRAECKAQTGDLVGAKADLEILRTKRMPAADAIVPASIANDQQALIRYVLDERIREFSGQGYRWFDMRRLSVNSNLNATVRYEHILYNADGTIIRFTLKPERLVLRLPQKVIEQNPGMTNNP